MSTKQQPLITVIVPVYNILEYLPRCVQSITAQTYTNLEILLVDDGSTDGTGALCDRLAEEDERIRVFHKENGGSSSARNLALDHATGDYIGIVDSDDYIEPDMYERLYEGLAEAMAESVHYSDPGDWRCPAVAQIGRDEVDEQGNRMPNICEPPRERELIESKAFMRELLMHRGDCSFCTKLVARRLFRELRFPVGVLNEDFHLLVRMLEQTPGVVSLPGQAYHVFYRIGSNSRKADKEQFSRVFGDCVVNADMVEELVAENYPDLKAVALRFGVFQRLEYLLHIPISQMTRDNTFYRQVVAWLRKRLLRALGNKHLTGKNKIYMLLFAISPRGIRIIHKKLRRIS